MTLHCTQTHQPACAWTGTDERALIGHYLAHHHVPTTSDYVHVCDALREAHRELQRAEALVEQARVGFVAVLLHVPERTPLHRATRHYLELMEGRARV